MTRTLLIACSSLALAGCAGETITLNAPPPPVEWMQCAELPVAPDLSPLERITLPDGRVGYIVAQTNARDAQIARYIVAIRGAHFECWNNLAKVRGYYEAQPAN